MSNGTETVQNSYDAEYATVTEKRIKAAWKALNMPRLRPMHIDQEGERWYVSGEELSGYWSVELASGPGSYDGLSFEEL